MLSLIPLPIRLLVALLLLVGTGFIGYHQGTLAGRLAMSEFVQLKDAEISGLKDKMIDISNQHTVQFVDRTNTIEKVNTVYVNAANNKVPSQYNLSNGWVYTHDQAVAQNPAPDATKMSDATPSDVKDNVALASVINNYNQCEKDRAQLHELIGTIKDAQELVKEKNKK